MNFAGTFIIFGVGFFVTSLMVFVVFGIVFYRVISEWNRNNRSPRVSVEATAVAKRDHVSHHHHHNGHLHTTHHTSYYVTFELESGDRTEFLISGREYGMIVEGDCGTLTFQGTRYLSFVRNRQSDPERRESIRL